MWYHGQGGDAAVAHTEGGHPSEQSHPLASGGWAAVRGRSNVVIALQVEPLLQPVQKAIPIVLHHKTSGPQVHFRWIHAVQVVGVGAWRRRKKVARRVWGVVAVLPPHACRCRPRQEQRSAAAQAQPHLCGARLEMPNGYVCRALRAAGAVWAWEGVGTSKQASEDICGSGSSQPLPVGKSGPEGQGKGNLGGEGRAGGSEGPNSSKGLSIAKKARLR